MVEPTITFIEHPDYAVNALEESAEAVSDGFEYNSGLNPHFLTIEEIIEKLESQDYVKNRLAMI